MSGYAAIGLHAPQYDVNVGGALRLHAPQYDVNVGGALRAIDCYQAKLLVVGGHKFTKFSTDTTKAWRRIPVISVPHVMDAIPYDCVPIAVDLVPNAISLAHFSHPKRAFYIFGPENGTLGKSVLDRCRHHVYIPTNGCMNLAATVNVVLFSRSIQYPQEIHPNE